MDLSMDIHIHGNPDNLLCRKYAAFRQNFVRNLQCSPAPPTFLTHDAAGHRNYCVGLLFS